MLSKWQWILGHLTRALWLRASVMALLAVLVIFAAMGADRFLPFSLPFEVEQSTIDNILNILASSMLAVTTFSLTVMVSAYGAATSNVTPRARPNSFAKTPPRKTFLPHLLVLFYLAWSELLPCKLTAMAKMVALSYLLQRLW